MPGDCQPGEFATCAHCLLPSSALLMIDIVYLAENVLMVSMLDTGCTRPIRFCLLGIAVATLSLGAADGVQAQEPVTAASLEEALQATASYKFGDSRAALAIVEDAVRASGQSPELRNVLIPSLMAMVNTDGIAAETLDFACRQLAQLQAAEAIPALAGMLDDDETSDIARYALERMHTPEANAALLAALDTASGANKIGVVNSLGDLDLPEAVERLRTLIDEQDLGLAAAAVTALAKITVPEARDALKTAAANAPPALIRQIQDALLIHADRLLDGGAVDDAVELYGLVLDAASTDALRQAAFAGKLRALGDNAAPLVTGALTAGDGPLHDVALLYARQPRSAEMTAALANRLASAPAGEQLVLLGVLEDRADPEALGAVVPLLGSSEPTVVRAALQALGKIGDGSCVPPLAEIATNRKAYRESQLAREALHLMNAPGVEDAIVNLAMSGPEPVRPEMVRCIAARNMRNAVPQCLSLIQDATQPKEAVFEAWKALGKLAGDEHVPRMLEALLNSGSETPRKLAEASISEILLRSTDEQRTAPLIAALDNATGSEARASLYAIIGAVGDETCLDRLRSACASDDPMIREASIRALASGANPAIIPDLLSLSESNQDGSLGVTCLRGVARLLRLPTLFTFEETLAFYEKALMLSKDADNKLMFISGLAEMPAIETLGLLEPLSRDPEVAEEAALAAEKILHSLISMSASHTLDDPHKAIDNDPKTHWCAIAWQEKGMWVTFDLGAPAETRMIILSNALCPTDYPRAFEVFVSESNTDWGAPVAEGHGNEQATKITWQPKTGRYIRIVITKELQGVSWSITEAQFVDPATREIGVRPIRDQRESSVANTASRAEI